MSKVNIKKLTYENKLRVKYPDPESSKVQALIGESTFSIVLPKSFAISLGIGKGDFVRVSTHNQKMIMEKSD